MMKLGSGMGRTTTDAVRTERRECQNSYVDEPHISQGRFQNDFDWATYKYRNRTINGRTLYSKIFFLALEVSHEKSIKIVF